jgi:hypothetical protein
MPSKIIHPSPAALLAFDLFVAFRVGRHDSSCRHSDKCAGFAQFLKKCEEKGARLSPVSVTKGEFKAVKEFRRTGRPEDDIPYPVQRAVFSSNCWKCWSRTLSYSPGTCRETMTMAVSTAAKRMPCIGFEHFEFPRSVLYRSDLN